jgi:hypothetical protein
MARARSPDSSNPFVFAFPLPTFLYSKYLTDTPTFGSHRHKGYFAPNANRPNLVVLLNAHATKLTLSGTAEPYVVSGVQFTVGEKSYEVKANKEVILSAGAYGTPQLLELSGTFFFTLFDFETPFVSPMHCFFLGGSRDWMRYAMNLTDDLADSYHLFFPLFLFLFCLLHLSRWGGAFGSGSGSGFDSC